MPVAYRLARAEDLKRTDELVVSSINELTERHGFGPMASPSPPYFQMFSLKDDPDGLWIAEDAGQILGFGFSWVCGDLWFLAQLFVAPGQQGRGIGNELLKRTLAHAQKAGATNKALITFTFNRVSQGLYIRHGLFPRFPIYFLSVQREALVGRLSPTQLRSVPLEDKASHLNSIALIDARALGVSREKHHRYLIEDSETTGVLLCAGDDAVGYAYIANGHIGPLAVANSDMLGTAFATALNLAAESGAAKVSAFLPGLCETALSIAIEHGMRITLPMVLMSTRNLGDWTLYLPRNPGFM
jgi:ribosomal protein S18 acetylase RimI-like enzyme